MVRSPLDKRIKELRNLINSPWKQHALLQDAVLWPMLCSCMDTIQDTEAALECFLIEKIDRTNRGKTYLHIYGALQALFMQQDAVDNLHTSLNIEYPGDARLQKIRDIRNYATGHPTNKSEKGVKGAFNFVHSVHGSPYEFHLMTVYPRRSNDGRLNSKHKDIDIADLIDTQKSIFMKVLDDVIATLKEEAVEHKKKFRDNKLADTFTLCTYWFEKVFNEIHSTYSGHAPFAVNCIDNILKSINEFKDGLEERGEPDDHIFDVYENLDYALQHLKAHFEPTIQTHINEKDVYIFAYFAREHVQSLKEMAVDIDKQYSQ